MLRSVLQAATGPYFSESQAGFGFFFSFRPTKQSLWLADFEKLSIPGGKYLGLRVE
jgi:hypothetical protein